ncbi:hypothetical protein RJ639_010181 [Escallonia herrerae]|uniref:Reverse transcriptase Ty1/copia-type domain-containing protein n=1 Tax=Escallonia herrerae TaxID=1293975 RepID=A0AA89ATG6_9ASTE|nr:hypothetical protein RJ639_010181 [Escallonia herrerae]
MFVKMESGKRVVVLLYVDDMIITRDNNDEISRLKNDLSIRFEMNNLGKVGSFLGLEVERSEDGFFISQKGYAKSLLEHFCTGETKEIANSYGALSQVKERPDIAYPVGVISHAESKDSSPRCCKEDNALCKGSLEYGLMYKKGGNFLFSGFSGVDWAGDANDRHSTTGYCFSMGSTAISWCSKKQPSVALSNTEAEYIAATMAMQECIWLKRLISDIYKKVDYAVPIHCDNESAIKLASNPVFHGRTKHIEVRHHFVREKVLSQDIKLDSVRTSNQVADLFTKALAESKFERFRAALGMLDHKHGV